MILIWSLASSPSMKSAFSPLGLLPEVPPPVVVLIGLDRDQVCGAITLILVGVPAEVPMEFIRTCTASDDVAPVAAVDQVITITAIDDVSTGKTPEGFTTGAAVEDRAFGHAVPGVLVDLLALDQFIPTCLA